MNKVETLIAERKSTVEQELQALIVKCNILKRERDEARRELCAFASGRYRKDVVTLDRAAAIAEAKRRGWDCFKDVLP